MSYEKRMKRLREQKERKSVKPKEKVISAIENPIKPIEIPKRPKQTLEHHPPAPKWKMQDPLFAQLMAKKAYLEQ